MEDVLELLIFMISELVVRIGSDRFLPLPINIFVFDQCPVSSKFLSPYDIYFVFVSCVSHDPFCFHFQPLSALSTTLTSLITPLLAHSLSSFTAIPLLSCLLRKPSSTRKQLPWRDMLMLLIHLRSPSMLDSSWRLVCYSPSRSLNAHFLALMAVGELGAKVWDITSRSEVPLPMTVGQRELPEPKRAFQVASWMLFSSKIHVLLLGSLRGDIFLLSWNSLANVRNHYT